MRYSSGKTRIANSISGAMLNDMGGVEVTQYSSGKSRISKAISEVIRNDKSKSCLTLVSLFCGGLSVETKLAPYFDKVICNDKQEYLIELYKALQNGWQPPDSLSEEEYKYIKEHKDENKALTAFVGFGCSFGGKWFGGYGRHGTKDKHASERSMCEESKRALLRDIGILYNCEFLCLDYRDVPLPDSCVVYADPPYKGKMAAFGLKEKFDIDEFWDYMRVISKEHKVYISELEAPDDFKAIWEKPVLRQIANCNAENFVANEKLFVCAG